MPYRREAEVVLEMWREVERKLADVPDNTPQAESLQADAARMRDEYARLIEQARLAHREEPPPFPAE